MKEGTGRFNNAQANLYKNNHFIDIGLNNVETRVIVLLLGVAYGFMVGLILAEQQQD